MPFGTLELLGIEPENLGLEVAPGNGPLYARASVIDPDTRERMSLYEFIKKTIEIDKHKEIILGKMGFNAGILLDRGLLDQMVGCDFLEAMGHSNLPIAELFARDFFKQKEVMDRFIFEKLFSSNTGKKGLRGELEDLDIIGLRPTQIMQERGKHVKAYIEAMREISMKAGLSKEASEFRKKVLKEVLPNALLHQLMGVLKGIPPLTLEIEINGKTYKNGQAVLALLNESDVDLTLTQLSEVLDHVKNNEKVIGPQGVELLKRQLDKFSGRVASAGRTERAILNEDYRKAFKIEGEGEKESFGSEGLKKYFTEKSWSKLEKYFRKILRFLTGKQGAYQAVKTTRANAKSGFERLSSLLKDPEMASMGKDMAEAFETLARTSPALSVSVPPEPEAVRVHVAAESQPTPDVGSKPAVSGTLGPKVKAAMDQLEQLRQTASATSASTGIQTGASHDVSELRERFESPKQNKQKPAEPSAPRPRKSSGPSTTDQSQPEKPQRTKPPLPPTPRPPGSIPKR